MEHLIRDCFKREGYIFATRAVEIARRHGHSRIAHLASNENPFPPSPFSIDRAKTALREGNRYPDEGTAELKFALRDVHGDHSFVTGVGMDGVIETVIRVLIEPGDLVTISSPTFSFYQLAARAQGGSVRNIPRNEDFSIDTSRFIDESQGAKLAFICSPNNPTGNAVPPDQIREILRAFEGMLFLDNAYVEFSGYDYRNLMENHPNLIIGRTFSKAYSLAGLRVGYAFVPAWFEPYYQRAETPFALNSVSSAAAAGALSDQEHVDTIIRHVAFWRDRFTREIPYRVYPSDANFVLVDVSPHTAEQAVELLAKRGVIVRSCTSFPGLGDQYIRVSIGDAWENERFLQEISGL